MSGVVHEHGRLEPHSLLSPEPMEADECVGNVVGVIVIVILISVCPQPLSNSNLIYIFDSVHAYVPYGRPQCSTDLDRIWRAASLL